MKPDLCPFVCHSSGFHLISFAYLLRSQSGYHFIVACAALLRGSVQCLPSLSLEKSHFFHNMERQRIPARRRLFNPLSGTPRKPGAAQKTNLSLRRAAPSPDQAFFHPSRPYQRARTRDMNVRWSVEAVPELDSDVWIFCSPLL